LNRNSFLGIRKICPSISLAQLVAWNVDPPHLLKLRKRTRETLVAEDVAAERM